MIWIIAITGGMYVLIIGSFFYGWEKLVSFVPQEQDTGLFVSVIVPIRNEQDTIPRILADLRLQEYPAGMFEVIVVNDHSTDDSLYAASLCNAANFKLLSLPEGITGKKAAIRYGIEESKGDVIVTTDADCSVGSRWLFFVASYFKTYLPVMVLAPVAPQVCFSEEPVNPVSIIRKGFNPLLDLEFFSLLGSTAGSAAIGLPVMCNGANLAFLREVYSDIEKVYQNEKVRSGDDVFAMLELKKKYPGKVLPLKSREATVYTNMAKKIPDFFRQRGRWASKAKFYTDPFVILTALVVFGMNLCLAWSFVYGILHHRLFLFVALLAVKSLVDFPFLFRVTGFFKRGKLMFYFPLVQTFYFIYVCTTVLIAIVLPLGWKGRRL